MDEKKDVLLIGTGYMAAEYAKVLLDLPVNITVVGRSEEGCSKFYSKTGIKPIPGGIQKYLDRNPENTKSTYVIVAASADQLEKITLLLLSASYMQILVEKPAALDSEMLKLIAETAKEKSANVFVAYNRRHYASTIKALEIAKEDGGILSCNFEFTEWSHIIKSLNHSESTRNNWFIANSTHVIDLAFFYCGKPAELSAYSSGTLDWSTCNSIYTGAGITDNGILFSYNANWVSAGRWGVELLTPKHRIILRPLEKVQIQNIGSADINNIDINDNLDIKYKPGLFKEVSGFLNYDIDAAKRIKTIYEQLNDFEVYNKISNNGN